MKHKFILATILALSLISFVQAETIKFDESTIKLLKAFEKTQVQDKFKEFTSKMSIYSAEMEKNGSVTTYTIKGSGFSGACNISHQEGTFVITETYDALMAEWGGGAGYVYDATSSIKDSRSHSSPELCP
jgi:hypothetical protein